MAGMRSWAAVDVALVVEHDRVVRADEAVDGVDVLVAEPFCGRDVVAEAKATAARRQARFRTVITGSYGSYYRQMLPRLLDALQFRCNNAAYRPVMDAIDLYRECHSVNRFWFHAPKWAESEATAVELPPDAAGSPAPTYVKPRESETTVASES
jgi:hypothetical protein